MEEIISGRFSEEIRHANNLLELLGLVDSVNSKEAVSQMLQKILPGFKGDNQSIKNIDCLKLVLLCKARMEMKEKTDGLSIEDIRSIVRLCLFQPKDECKLVYLDAVEIALWLLNDDKLREISLEIVQIVQTSLNSYMTTGICVHENTEISPLYLLNLLEKTIQVFYKRFSHENLEEHKFQKFLNIDSISNLLIEVAVNDNGVLSVNVLTRLIPALVEASSSTIILSKLWAKLAVNWKGDNWKEVDFDGIYLVLSSVAHLFLSRMVVERKESCILVQDNKFWEIVLFGIGQKNPTVRKQSRFLLRKAVDFILSNPSALCMHISTDLFSWNHAQHKDYNEPWNEYLLILEALEEKQVHLIEPLLIIFEKHVNNRSSHVSIAWVLPVYQRMLCHDSNQIVKFGLQSFLSLDLARFDSSNGNIVSFLLYPLLNALNNTYLYMKQDDKDFEVEYCFSKMLSSLSNCPKEGCYSFYEEFLSRFSEIPWGPVPLFYLMKSFSSLNLERKVWKSSSLNNLKLFLTNTLHTHSVHIRGAIQSCALKAMINFLCTENLDVFDLADVVGAFSQNESLKRGFYSWNLLVEWFKKIFDHGKALKYVTTSLSQLQDSSSSDKYVNGKSVARMIILLCDSSFLIDNYGANKFEVFYHAMKPSLKHLDSLESRPYASDSLVGTAICVLGSILEECSPLQENDSTLDAVISVVTPLMGGVIYYIRRKLFSLINVNDFYCITVYLKLLNSFVNEKKILSCFLKHSEGLVDDAFHVLELDKQFTLCRYFSFQILCLFGNLLVNDKCLGYEKAVFNYNIKLSLFVQHILQKRLINQCDTIKNDEFNDCGEINNFKGQIITEYIKSCWLLLYCDLKTNSGSEESILAVRNVDLLLEDALESLEIGGKEVLSPVMRVFQVLLPQAMESSFELSWKFCNLCWQAAFEHRKSDFFWVALKGFIQMVFQFKIMLLPLCEIKVTQLSQELLSQSQTVGRIFRIFISHLYHETCKHGTLIWKKYYNVLVDSLTYGPVLRKDQRIYKDTCEYIQSFGAEYTVNSFLSSDSLSETSVRIKGLSILLSIMESEGRGDRDAKGMTEILADCLSKRILENIDAKSRYYGNSHVHRLKQRAMQSLLILETSLSKERREQLLVAVSNSLSIESHQPSVKYLQEWLLVRILTHQPDLRGKMWEIFHQVGVKRPGCMSSFIAVMYHLTKTTPHEQLEQFLKECLQHILPCCMAQQFSVRLYAQVVIHKLWELVISHNFEMVVKEYTIAYDCLNSGFDQANNVQKNLNKLKENFYFNAFHPADHFSIETVFYEIPRLSNVSRDECITISELEIVKSNKIIPLQNSDNLLKQQSVGEWVAKSNDYCADPTADKSSNLQKKIMPWKSCVSQPEELVSEDFDNISHRNYERNRNRDEGLIVVASLIDRMPNLGGLCRTCEAFNVSEYVLGSLKYIEDKQFQNLSVTAESWIPISEIKPFMLAQYLKSMKEKGYTLVGAEQTSNSKSLNDFKFPKKSLLLLGNEKGGIPADLLPLLDVCVEVPQQGVIRSLNVHVTGALFVWEYARQNSCNT